MQSKFGGSARPVLVAFIVAALCVLGISRADAQLLPNSGSSSGAPPSMGAPPAFHGDSFGSAQPRVAAIAPPASGATSNRLGDYVLGPGDRVHIVVYGKADLTGTYPIDGAGKLRFPLIGSVRAAGLTESELEQLIVSKLKPQYFTDPNVIVEVVNFRPFYILGEVRSPGGYAYVAGMSVVIGVAIAGGFTYRARESSFGVTRTRPDGTKEHLTVTQDTQVEPGDIITVNERYF